MLATCSCCTLGGHCRYYVRVAAVNTAGMGPFAVATQPMAAPYFPYAVPNVPAGAILTSGIGASTSALQVCVCARWCLDAL